MTAKPALTDAHMRVGKFRLLSELGAGGMAEVFLAVDDHSFGSFTKLVVVKRVRKNLAEDEEYATLLLDEACISARLNHPNVVQIIEYGVDRGIPFLAMEYLEGHSLAQLQRRADAKRGGLPADVTCAVLCDVLAGLHYAHELADFDARPLSIVHRDVTPQNVFVTYDGHVKLLDFGIAKAEGRMMETQLGMTRGKVRYMCPEQAASKPLDRRTDIFAVGVMLWQAACGSRFWSRELSDNDVMGRLVRGAYDPSPRAVRPEVPEAIDAICRRALAFDREARYATADEMLHDLQAYLGSGEVEARRQLTACVRELFSADRAARRGLLEPLATPSTLKHALDTAAELANRSGQVPIFVEPAVESERGADAATSVSLAKILEPGAMEGVRRSPFARLRQRFAAFAILAAVGLVVGGAAVATKMRLEVPRGEGLRPASSAANERKALALASEGLSLRPVTTAESEPGPASSGAASAGAAASAAPASTTAKAKRTIRPAPKKKTPPSAKTAPAAAKGPSATGKTTSKPPLDDGDPWR